MPGRGRGGFAGRRRGLIPTGSTVPNPDLRTPDSSRVTTDEMTDPGPEAPTPMSTLDDEPQQAETSPDPRPSLWAGRASAADASEFAGHLAALVATGLPLPSGLRALAGELPSRRLGSAMTRAADRLELGVPLDAALVGLAGEFPPHLRGLMVAGARSGKLADVLGQYVRYANLGAILRRRFWMVVAYPVCLLAALTTLYVFVCTYVVHVFESILKDFGVDRPGMTEALFLVARATRERGATVAAVGLGAGLVGLLVYRFTMAPAARRTIATGIPIFGPILRYSALAEFCHLAGLLVEGQMPLPEALALAGEGVNDAELARAGIGLRRSSEAGRTIAESMGAWHRCPAGLREVVEGSERRGDLAAALHLAGDMFEARTRAQASFASTLFAAMTLLVVIWGIGFVLVALYLPIINLFSKLTG